MSASGLEDPNERPLPGTVGTAGGGLATQLFRFAVSGGFSAMVDFGLLLVFLHVGLPFVVAKTFSFIAGTTTAYLINRRWTFQAAPSRKRFLAVAALYGAMFVVQVGISTGLHSVLPPGTIWVLVAFVVAQGVATIVNFVVQRQVVFTMARPEPAGRGR